MTGREAAGSGAEPHNRHPHASPAPRKKTVAFVLLKPKGFENVLLRLKKWVPEDQLDRGWSPGLEPAWGTQQAILGHLVSLRLR